MNRTALVAVLVLVPPVLRAGGLFAVDAPTAGDYAIIDAITTQTTAQAAQHIQIIFMLQTIAVSSGMILGITIFNTWMRARQSRLP